MPYFEGLNNLSAPPIRRAAYSDRMAWIMAELSSLVYLELPPEKNSTSIVDFIKDLLNKNQTTSVIKLAVRKKFSHVSSNPSKIEEHLKILNQITLIEAFVVDDSEAILIKFEQDKDIFYALAFRGTSSPHDVKTDIDVNLGAIDENNPKIKAHKGFYKTIKKLLPDIESRIKELNNKTNIPLYITGHSLGGAWAMIATQQLQQLPNLAATYTFGCPRTANDAFYTDMRSPVYRVVHRADIVTRIPFGYGLNIFIYLLILTTRFIPFNGTKAVAEWLRRKILGYTHYGHMIYLNGSIEKKLIRVRFAPNVFYLLHDFGAQIITNFTNIGKDHFIEHYREKLRWYAIDRNK